ncbi:MAG TPA: FeoA family protein [Cellvibrionaceae bacterium]|nr:FeoA family protein [Cellvibrionaceae bacterium]
MQAVTAEYLSPDLSTPVSRLSLTECSKGQHVMLTELRPNPAFGDHDNAVTARMKALGFLPGVQLTVIGYGLFGRDPLAVQINGTKFALRRAEAHKLIVIPL